MKTYTVVYFGTWGYGHAGLKALASMPQVEVIRVFSKWDPRKSDPYMNKVYDLARQLGLDVISTNREHMSKESFGKEVLSCEPFDILLSCCYDRFFSDHLISIAQMAALNVHPSLLPKYRGVKPLENAMAKGENRIGVSLHELVREMDAGDILLQRSSPMHQDDTFLDLYGSQCEMIKNCLREFFSGPEVFINAKRPQDHSVRSDAPRLPFLVNDHDTVADIQKKAAQHKLLVG